MGKKFKRIENCKRLIIFCFLLTVSGCAGYGGLGSYSKADYISRGMTQNEVREILGEPVVSEDADHIIWTYRLHQAFVGWVPCHAFFNKNTGLLEFWDADAKRYFGEQMRTVTPQALGALAAKIQSSQKSQTPVYSQSNTPSQIITANQINLVSPVPSVTPLPRHPTFDEAIAIVRSQWIANMPPGYTADMNYATNTEFQRRVDEVMKTDLNK